MNDSLMSATFSTFLSTILSLFWRRKREKREMRKDNNIVVHLGVIHHNQHQTWTRFNVELRKHNSTFKQL